MFKLILAIYVLLVAYIRDTATLKCYQYNSNSWKLECPANITECYIKLNGINFIEAGCHVDQCLSSDFLNNIPEGTDVRCDTCGEDGCNVNTEINDVKPMETGLEIIALKKSISIWVYFAISVSSIVFLVALVVTAVYCAYHYNKHCTNDNENLV